MNETPVEVRRLAVGPIQSNCYLVRRPGAAEAVVIDPGEEAPRIVEALEEWFADPVAILVTHGHMDHVGAVAALVERYHIPVYLHAADLMLYERAAEHAAMFGLAIEAPPPPDFGLEQTASVAAAGLRFAVRHVPGHSPGGVLFYLDGAAFVGDSIFAGSIGRTDLPGGDTDTLLRAIGEQIMTLPPDTVLYPGHGPETKVATEQVGNPFLTEPCLRCGSSVPARRMGCRAGHCPNCGHPYPHGDCSD